jgi:urea transport system permease protein
MSNLFRLVRRTWLCAVLALALPMIAHGQTDVAGSGPLQALLQQHQEAVARPSRGTVRSALDALLEAELPGTAEFLRIWADRNLFAAPDGRFFYTREGADRTLVLIDIDTGAEVGTATSREMSQIRPNAGVRQDIASALVQFELSGSDPALRRAAVEAIARAPEAVHIPLIAASLEDEDDPALANRKERLLQLLLARFAEGADQRIAAIMALAGDVSTEARRTLNQILATDLRIAETLPEGVNIARIRTPGTDFGRIEAYDLLVAAGLATARPERNAVRDALRAHIADGQVGGVALAELSAPDARLRAHGELVSRGLVPALVTDVAIDAALAGFVFFDEYREPDARVTAAAQEAIDSTRTRISFRA